MKWHKSYREQGQECKKTGNRFIISWPWYDQDIVVCVPFKTYCHSKACVEKRNLLDDVWNLKNEIQKE